jgi:hypothetical protein
MLETNDPETGSTIISAQMSVINKNKGMIACRQVPLPGSIRGVEEDPVGRVCNVYGATLFSQECRFFKVQKNTRTAAHGRGEECCTRKGSRI